MPGKVLTVVGARPQFVKAAPVSRALAGRLREVLVHTGQHYDEMMSDVFFRELGLAPPTYNLGVGSDTHGRMTGRMLAALDEVLEREAPDLVLVYGDTNSTLAGALAAVKMHIPVAHVEAGLRSFNRALPEEINRIATDHIATLLFAPTEAAMRQLGAEGITQGVHLTGDVMFDAVRLMAEPARQISDVYARLGVAPGGYYLATVHRPSNTDDPANLAAILAALSRLDRPVVFPAHPRTRRALARLDGRLRPPANVLLTEPLGYLDMLALERGARRVLTDSGGVQKEAYFFAVPCVTLRSETEWTETVAAGWNTVAGVDPDRIVAATARPRPSGAPPPVFGDGRAAERIVEVIEGYLTAPRQTSGHG